MKRCWGDGVFGRRGVWVKGCWSEGCLDEWVFG